MTFQDKLIGAFDAGLRVMFGVCSTNQKENRFPKISDPLFTPQEKKEIASLFRVNHAGEVAAQALYHGQALFMHNKDLAENLLRAADEESLHLQWCQNRILEMGGHVSFFTPLWFLGSFFIGIWVAQQGDAWNLGFIVETEHQVGAHIQSHLERLPPNDIQSRNILKAMQEDELQHAAHAKQWGATELSGLVQQLMTQTARLMTGVSFYL